MSALVEVEALSVALGGAVVVESLSLRVDAGQLHGLVGESGSGKTSAANAMLGLTPPGARVQGVVRIRGVDLLASGEAGLARARGRSITLVPQEPLAALDPVATVGAHLDETLATHTRLTKEARRARSLELLGEVGLPEPAALMKSFPHQLSGGQRQRVLLAAALACEPAFLIADEPTTALDASLKGVVLALLRRLAAEREMAVLLISHDLGAVRAACGEVTVLYAGRVMEQGPVDDVFARPRHPYTRALLDARPEAAGRGRPLEAIDGVVPAPKDVVPGCRFHPRCRFAKDRCRIDAPRLGDGPHRWACHYPLGEGGGA